MVLSSPFLVLLLAAPFHALAISIENHALRRATFVLMFVVAPALFIAELVWVASVGTGGD